MNPTPLPRSRYDFVIIGAGIIGISVANELLKKEPKLKVLILEKESGIGFHASGRNSGVLHAGFYYGPDSLKAKFCKDGNAELVKLMTNTPGSIMNTGKIVVARNELEYTHLQNLHSRGLANDVNLELHDAELLRKYEPLARTYGGFIWSPSTSIGNPAVILDALLHEAKVKDLKIKFNVQIKGMDKESIYTETDHILYKHLVNCAGTQADRVAHSLGVLDEYSLMPFLGVYRTTNLKYLPIKTLVYPVPHVINPFLGVHLTMTLNGEVKIGPTAIPLLGREQYSWNSRVPGSDLIDTLKSAISIAKGSKHSLRQLITSDVLKLRLSNLIEDASTLVPDTAKVKTWRTKPPGIRAQLVNRKTGELVQDFIVETHGNATHVLNAVSPAWTSSIPFGKYVADKAYAAL